MAKLWFVGDVEELGRATVGAGDALVPLDAFAQRLLEGDRRLVALPDLRPWESDTVTRVVADLRRLVDSIRDEPRWRPWLGYRGHDLAPSLAKPDEAFLGFPKQLLAHRVASAVHPKGTVGAIGASPFQVHGIEAALDQPVEVAPWAREEAPRGRVAGLIRRMAAGLRMRARARSASILYLGLEPHVARQQDRVLELLARGHGIEVVTALRDPWDWPAGTAYRPRAVRGLLDYVGFRAFARLAGVGDEKGRRPPSAAPLPEWITPDQWQALVREQWLRGAALVEGLQGALAAHRPRLLIGTNMFSAGGKLATAVCRSAGVRVLGLPSGADFLVPPYLEASDVLDADYVLPGPMPCRRLAEAGAPADRLHPYGLPELDDLVRPARDPDPDAREALLRRHRIDPSRKVVTFFSSPSLPGERLLFPRTAKLQALDSLLACRARMGLEVLVKLHPRERDGSVVGHLHDRGTDLPIVTEPLPALLHASDAVASLGSSVTFAAAVLGRPALILDFGAAPLLTDVFRLTGVGISPASPEAVPGALAEALAEGGGRQQGFVSDWLSGADGRASERITALAKGLLNS